MNRKKILLFEIILVVLILYLPISISAITDTYSLTGNGRVGYGSPSIEFAHPLYLNHTSEILLTAPYCAVFAPQGYTQTGNELFHMDVGSLTDVATGAVSWSCDKTTGYADYTATCAEDIIFASFDNDKINLIPDNQWSVGNIVLDSNDGTSPLIQNYGGSFIDISTTPWRVFGYGFMSGDYQQDYTLLSTNISVIDVTSNYILGVAPSSVNYGNNFTIFLNTSENYNDVSEVKFGWSKADNPVGDILYDKDDYTLDYSLINGVWYQYGGSSFSINKGSSFPAPITLLPANFGTGNYIIDCYIIKSTNAVIHLTAPLTVTSVNMQTLTVHALDFDTGYLISTARINALNLASGIWDNRSDGGEQIFYYPYSQKLYFVLDSSSYMSATKNYTVGNTPLGLLDIVMYKGVNTPASNVSLRVNVMDNHDGYINNAYVSVLNDNSYFQGDSKYTNYAGVVIFTVLPTNDYAISVSKDGYLSSGKIVTSGTGGTTLDVNIVLIAGNNPTATPTTLPTPIITQNNNYGSPLGGNITPASCKLKLPDNSTILDNLKNNMACAGISSGQNQGYGISLMIIFVLGITGGKYGKGMGVVMGMSAGYVLSLAMGLVPVWTFVAMIIFICLILAIKLWSSDK